MQVNYKIYPSALDAYTDYLRSDDIYDKYWGFSENPPFTREEFEEKQYQSLIDKINRVPFDSEPADKGTAFNELIDAIVENRQVREEFIVQRAHSDGEKKEFTGFEVSYNGRVFFYPLEIVMYFKDYYKGGLTQTLVEGILPTEYGNVLLYGYADYVLPLTINDLKTTGKYEAFKFKNHWQHYVYPYCMIKNGSDIHNFEYNITDFKEIYKECYTFVEERDIPILTAHVEDFIRFLEDNREKITDKKIFGGEKDEQINK